MIFILITDTNMNNCTPCNNNKFILTNWWNCVDSLEDMYRLWSECLSCQKEVRKNCEEIVKNLNKEEKTELSKDSILHLNNHFNGDGRKSKSNKKRG